MRSQQSPGFLKPASPIEKTLNRVPHWRQDKTWTFLTWRLADSLPASQLRLWAQQRSAFLKQHPFPHDQRTAEVYRRQFPQRLEKWLDSGAGSCLLGDRGLGMLVAESILHFDGERYQVHSFIVMPNHVHVLVSPFDGFTVAEIMRSWKGYSARRLNDACGNRGKVWADSYYDRLVRDQKHLQKVVGYIRRNGEKAKLSPRSYLLWEAK